tara:strand:- start:62 stop:439 length:378 start_codon:yes stop_codon:yes gene_type:complete
LVTSIKYIFRNIPSNRLRIFCVYELSYSGRTKTAKKNKATLGEAMKIEIYGKDNCAYCDRAVALAQQIVQESEHKYEYFKHGRDFDTHDLLREFPNARTFPQIRIDGENIGGYNEFYEVIRGSGI